MLKKIKFKKIFTRYSREVKQLSPKSSIRIAKVTKKRVYSIFYNFVSLSFLNQEWLFGDIEKEPLYWDKISNPNFIILLHSFSHIDTHPNLEVNSTTSYQNKAHALYDLILIKLKLTSIDYEIIEFFLNRTVNYVDSFLYNEEQLDNYFVFYGEQKTKIMINEFIMTVFTLDTIIKVIFPRFYKNYNNKLKKVFIAKKQVFFSDWSEVGVSAYAETTFKNLIFFYDAPWANRYFDYSSESKTAERQKVIQGFRDHGLFVGSIDLIEEYNSLKDTSRQMEFGQKNFNLFKKYINDWYQQY